MSSDKNKIFIVRGFGTDNIKTNDTYANILLVLEQKNNDVTYFDYAPSDDIVETYNRLCKTIKNNNFTHMAAHSMGGGLAMKWIADHPKDVKKFKHVILLMAMLYKDPFNEFLAKIPIMKNVSVPVAIFLPSSKAYSTGNILNDGFKFMHLGQVFDMYNHIMLDSDEFVDVLNANKSNTVLFYATEEGFNIIPKEILNKIDNLKYVPGLHEPFNSLQTTKQFFKKFLPYFRP